MTAKQNGINVHVVILRCYIICIDINIRRTFTARLQVALARLFQPVPALENCFTRTTGGKQGRLFRKVVESFSGTFETAFGRTETIFKANLRRRSCFTHFTCYENPLSTKSGMSREADRFTEVPRIIKHDFQLTLVRLNIYTFTTRNDMVMVIQLSWLP